MAELWKAIVLGAVEGFTEFLPISSTGHLLVAGRFLDFQSSMGGTFEIFIQLGATLAMLLYFARDLIAQARTVWHSASVQRLWLNVIIAFVPAGLVGFFIHDWIKEVLFVSPYVVPISLILGGIVMFIVERFARGRKQTTDFQQLSHGQALAVGLAQIVSLIPGVSRSGATIVGGMFAGASRAAATRFSFYLAIPTMLIATLYDLLKSFGNISGRRLGAARRRRRHRRHHRLDRHRLAAALRGKSHAGALWRVSHRDGDFDFGAAGAGDWVRGVGGDAALHSTSRPSLRLTTRST
jgi:undecaprenyl-diphosphatase